MIFTRVAFTIVVLVVVHALIYGFYASYTYVPEPRDLLQPSHCVLLMALITALAAWIASAAYMELCGYEYRNEKIDDFCREIEDYKHRIMKDIYRRVHEEHDR